MIFPLRSVKMMINSTRFSSIERSLIPGLSHTLSACTFNACLIWFANSLFKICAPIL